MLRSQSLCVLFLQPLFYLVLFVFSSNVPSSVIDLSDKFLEVKNDGYWFVKLYAPWCAHCKRLAPIWEHVGHALADRNSLVRIAKMDCTRFASACTQLHVTGYPTLLFFRNGKEISYEGDREKEAMVDFAIKCSSASISSIANLVEYAEVKEKSQREPSFVYVPDGGDDSEIALAFKKTAEELFSRTRFYTIPQKIAPSDLVHGAVHVLKEKRAESFSGDPSSLHKWILAERWPLIARGSGSSLSLLGQIDKLLVLLVVNAIERHNMSTSVGVFYAEAIQAAKLSRKDDVLKEAFQFVWLDGNSIVNNIAMQSVPIPSLMAFNYTSYEYYQPLDSAEESTKDSMILWLHSLLGPDAKPLGGRAWTVRVQRMAYELYSNIHHMFSTQPLLSTCLFGVPLAFLSIITYSLCSADFSVDRDEIYPDDEEDEELPEEDDHEKAE